MKRISLFFVLVIISIGYHLSTGLSNLLFALTTLSSKGFGAEVWAELILLALTLLIILILVLGLIKKKKIIRFCESNNWWLLIAPAIWFVNFLLYDMTTNYLLFHWMQQFNTILVILLIAGFALYIRQIYDVSLKWLLRNDLDDVDDGAPEYSNLLPITFLLITCSTMMLEIVYTRIFSVTMWYHYAFMMISIAMFGLAFGAVAVYVQPLKIPGRSIYYLLAKLAAVFSISMIVTCWINLKIQFSPDLSLKGIVLVIIPFLLVGIPFMVSGIIVSLVLTRFPKKVGKLYAFDLFGAAFGCIAVYLLIKPLTGPGVVIACAAMVALSSFLLSKIADSANLKKATLALFAITLVLTVIQSQYSFLNIKWWKNNQVKQHEIIEEVWNSHSMVSIMKGSRNPMGWGFAESFNEERENATFFPYPEQIRMKIDGAALTVMTKFDGDLTTLDHLNKDITLLPYAILDRPEILVIGIGGGRDILSGLINDARMVTGVELNKDIISLLNNNYGDFTGHLDKLPNVRMFNDEARSWLAHSKDTFDLIQISLIDTWAATAAGAFVLSENSLYTKQAWDLFLKHLNSGGVLSVSRWYNKHHYGEIGRSLDLAYVALKDAGVSNPRDHVLVAAGEFVATIIMSKDPIEPDAIEKFRARCTKYDFTIVFTPEYSKEPIFSDLFNPSKREATMANSIIKLDGPLDDSPFFFNMVRFRDIFLRYGELKNASLDFNMRGIFTLVALFGLVVVLAFAGLLLPLYIYERHNIKKGQAPIPSRKLLPHSIFFACIGLGFILVEIGQIQRLTLALGHPVYSLVIVLFTFLLATGIGSFLTEKLILSKEIKRTRAIVALSIVFVFTLCAALFSNYLINSSYGMGHTAMLALSVVFLLLLGLPMGASFPLGLFVADKEIPRVTPWLWAVNGTTSVIGSVLAVILSIGMGITFTCTVGAACYLCAAVFIAVNFRGH